MQEEEERGDMGAIAASIRSAKKATRPTRIGEPERRAPSKKDKSRERKARSKKAARVSTAGFDREMGRKAAKPAANEGARAKRGDAIGGMNGKSKGGKSKIGKPSGKAVKGKAR
jgi:ATP-dependent RNA helicase DDX27